MAQFSSLRSTGSGVERRGLFYREILMDQGRIQDFGRRGPTLEDFEMSRRRLPGDAEGVAGEECDRS